MGQIVVTGGQAMCMFGTTPTGIITSSQSEVLVGNKPAGTIMDCGRNNIATFGMCISLANPQVAAATAAALGVLTPQPCQILPAGPWIPMKPCLNIGGKPCLTSDCKLVCAMGWGMISIISSGQVEVLA